MSAEFNTKIRNGKESRRSYFFERWR